MFSGVSESRLVLLLLFPSKDGRSGLSFKDVSLLTNGRESAVENAGFDETVLL